MERKNINHRVVFETFHGPIKDGSVIDHIDSCRQNNKLDNLRAVTQSQNTKTGRTGNYSKKPKRTKSFDNVTTEENKYFSQSMKPVDILIFVGLQYDLLQKGYIEHPD